MQPAGVTFLIDRVMDGVVPLTNLADDCGSGKTFTILLTIDRISRLGRMKTMHRPSMIVVPATILVTWLQQIKQHFPQNHFTVYRYYQGSKSPLDNQYGVQGVDSRETLLKTARTLDPKDSQTSRTIFITSYHTHNARQGPPELDFKFLLLVADEATQAKNTLTQTSQSLQEIQAEHVIYSSATPILNTAKDALGFLVLLNRPMHARNKGLRSFIEKSPPKLNDYMVNEQLYQERVSAGLKYRESRINEQNRGLMGKATDAAFVRHDLRLLDLDTVAKFFHSNTLTVDEAEHILHVVTRMTTLRRTFGSKIDKGSAFEAGTRIAILGAGIPPTHVHTVELGQNENERDMFMKHYHLMFEQRQMGKSRTQDGADDDNTPHVNHTVERALQVATFDPSNWTLDAFIEMASQIRKATKEKDDMEKDPRQKSVQDYPLPEEWLRDFDIDDYTHGLRAYLHLKRKEPGYTPPLSRVDCVKELTATSAKLRYLGAKLLLHKMNTKKVNGEALPDPQRAIAYFQWPVDLYLAEAMCSNLGLKVSLLIRISKAVY